MTKTGRNEPCPCGSGRKYKRCCLDKERRAPLYTREDRAIALAKLQRTLTEMSADDPEWHDEVAQLADEFWGGLRDEMEELGNDYVSSNSEAAFGDWILFDVMLDRELSALDLVLEHAPSLDIGERRWLEQQTAQCQRLYEITDVQRGSSLTLRDLLNGAELTVQERLGSQTLSRWDVIAARVMPVGASGRPEIDGVVFHFPRLQREAVVGKLKDSLAQLREEWPDAETELLKECAPEIHRMWLSLWIAPPVPELETATGEALLMTSVHFDVTDEDALASALDGCAALEREPHHSRWVWLGPAEDDSRSAGKTLLGGLTLADGHLTLDTMSRERAAEGRALVERLAGKAVRHRVTSHEDPRRTIQEHLREGPRASEPEPPPDEVEDLILGHCEAHYRRWVDEPVPALDGSTPRAAAGNPALRPRLVAMLRDLEHLYLKALTEGVPAYDPSWMWSELRLGDHPDAPTRFTDRPPRLGHEAVFGCQVRLVDKHAAGSFETASPAPPGGRGRAIRAPTRGNRVDQMRLSWVDRYTFQVPTFGDSQVVDGYQAQEL